MSLIPAREATGLRSPARPSRCCNPPPLRCAHSQWAATSAAFLAPQTHAWLALALRPRQRGRTSSAAARRAGVSIRFRSSGCDSLEGAEAGVDLRHNRRQGRRRL